jgi:hypothetical protein
MSDPGWSDEPSVLAADGPAVSCPPPALGHCCLKCSSLGHSSCTGKWLLMVQLSPVHHLPWAIAVSSALHWATALAQVNGCGWPSCLLSTICPGPLLSPVLFIGPQPLHRYSKWLLMAQLSPVHHLPWAIAVSSALHWATALAQVK